MQTEQYNSIMQTEKVCQYYLQSQRCTIQNEWCISTVHTDWYSSTFTRLCDQVVNECLLRTTISHITCDKHTFKFAGGTILLDTALWTLVTTGCTVRVILYTATATLVQWPWYTQMRKSDTSGVTTVPMQTHAPITNKMKQLRVSLLVDILPNFHGCSKH